MISVQNLSQFSLTDKEKTHFCINDKIGFSFIIKYFYHCYNYFDRQLILINEFKNETKKRVKFEGIFVNKIESIAQSVLNNF
jgi:hypothetical protein